MTFQMDTTVLVNLVMKELIVKKGCKILGVFFCLFILFLCINSLKYSYVFCHTAYSFYFLKLSNDL